MKKILFLLLSLQTGFILNAQTLDYTNYHVAFYDEFDYPNLTSGLSSSGTTAGTSFLHNWIIVNSTGPRTIFETSQVSLSSAGSSPNYLMLTENFNPDSLLDISGTDTFSRKSGEIKNNNSNFVFNYGIIEARIRFPAAASPASPAFWTGGGGSYLPSYYTEIDVFDAASWGDWLPVRVVDYYYNVTLPYKLIYPYDSSAYCITYGADHSQIVGSTGISDLADWHIYSAQWNPTDVSYYLDGHLLANIPYTQVRTYPGENFLLLCLYGSKYANDGQHLDIDWVKVWKQNCYSGSVLNLSSTSTSSVVIPGLYKHDPIIASSSTLISTDPLNPTILESPSTTIESNFLADESNPDTRTYTFPYNAGILGETYTSNWEPYGPVFFNGFFEILPTNCTTGPGETGYKNSTATGYQQNSSINDFNTNSKSLTTGNALNDNMQVNVFPNPTHDNITISYPCPSTGQLEINIKDVSSREIYSEIVTCNEGGNLQNSIDISSFIPGVYFIYLTLNDQHVIKKIVKF